MSTPDSTSEPVTLEAVDADSLEEARAAFNGVFGNPDGGDEALERSRRTMETDRLVVARSRGEIVGTAGNYSFDMALPWAGDLPCAGVTMVSVRADHRRRGLLRRMMDHLFDDAVERGEPLAALWASEGPIYGRFGFGPAIPTGSFEVERVHARFREQPDVSGVQLIGADDAAARFPAIYDAVRRQRHGALSRNEAWWRFRVLADPPERREGAGPKRFAIMGDRGYAIYRLRPSWGAVGPEGTVSVQELVATDPDAHAALWRFVIETDLSSLLETFAQPIDDPLPFLLDDPGRASTRYPGWPVQVRLLDVARVLSTRGYGSDGSLTFALRDRSVPANAGTWHLEVQDGRASCERTERTPQLSMDAEALATVSLGGVRVTQLAGAGSIEVHEPEAVLTLGRLLATDVAPWHGGMF